MNLRRLRAFLLPGIGVALVVVGVVLINQHANIAYPLDTWRMDLDDALVGLGTILLGIAAIWTVWLKARDADRKADALSKKLNGGLSNLAAQILNDEIKQAGIDISLANRVATLEEKLEHSHGALEECRRREEEWKRLKARIGHYLDESGVGREEPREGH